MSPRPRPRPAPSVEKENQTPRVRRRVTRPTTQRQIIDRLLDAVSVQRGPTSFVQIERSPRGQVIISVTVHQGSEPGIDTIAATKRRATEIYDELARKYPVVTYE